VPPDHDDEVPPALEAVAWIAVLAFVLASYALRRRLDRRIA
jgi:hypothetical protein